MRILIIALLAGIGCRDRVPHDDEPIAVGKITEPDDDFVQTRATTQSRMRVRLAQLNARIAEIGDDASIHLRALRDELAARVEQIDEQGETAWDTFRSQLERSFDELERQLTQP